MTRTQVGPETARSIYLRCKERATDPISGFVRLDEYMKCLEEETQKALKQ